MNTEPLHTSMRVARATRLVPFVGLLALLTCAAPASALEFGFDFTGQSLRSFTTSANGWAKNRTFSGVGLRGELGITDKWRVGFGWGYAGSDGALHGRGTSTARHDLTLDGRFRYPLWDWLVPYARVGAGLSRTALTMESWSGDGWAPHLLAGGGLELLLPATLWRKTEDQPLPAFGVQAEVGWQMLGDLDATLTTAESVQPGVQPQPLQLGRLSLNGVTLRFGAVARF